GFVFQNFNLVNLDTVNQNVRLPYESISNKGIHTLNKRVEDVLRIVGLSFKKDEQVNNLSGGQKQRIAIARALINNPKIILCDEPTGALDSKNSQEIVEILHKISKHSLVIISTHDAELFNNYADKILRLKNNSFEITEQRNWTKNDKRLLIRDVGKTSKHVSLPLDFKFRHSYQKMKVKKYRTLITNMMISLSLTSIGMSLILSGSLNAKLESAFSSLFTSSQIIMTPKRSNPNIYDGIYSANRNQVEEIANKYSEYIEGVGATYLVNFEEFFKDDNELYISSEAYKIPLPSYSIRSINDFKWISDNNLVRTYPGISSLENDELVLGLKYDDMANLCYKLHIQRNYVVLGEYIKNRGVFITLSVENEDWWYSDEQIFRLAGVVETTSPVIYHTNKLWNEYIFEEQMRFPSGDGTPSNLPWIMYKLYYLTTYGDPKQFLNMAMYDNELFDFSFERTNYSYHPTICKPNQTCKENRLLVYYVDKTCIHMNDVKTIIRYYPELSNYYMSTNFGYISYGAAMMSGFSQNAFISVSDDMLDEAMDAEASMHNESAAILDLQKGILQGNYANSVGGGFQYSTNFKSLSMGNMPDNDLEIVVSTGLAKSLGLGDNPINIRLHFGCVSNAYIEDDVFYKDYSKATLKIVGVIEADENIVYQYPDWSVSFFRDELGISSFNLTPSSVIFEFDDKSITQKVLPKLNQLFTDYTFVDPISDAVISVDSTLSYMQTILLIFSVVTMVIAIILLTLVILINVAESEEEIKLFSLLGFSNIDIYSMFICHSLLQGFVSFLMSAFELIGIDYLLNIALSKLLNGSIGFSFDFTALLVEFSLMLVITIVTSLIVSFAIILRDNKAKKRRKTKVSNSY
ncbi:MAG: ATP-binding cassette domain-containing protein, partial [Bacilli bacterium]|nr:ATP-binding cassette domain-containing protein [Bacilli bacterium]